MATAHLSTAAATLSAVASDLVHSEESKVSDGRPSPARYLAATAPENRCLPTGSKLAYEHVQQYVKLARDNSTQDYNPYSRHEARSELHSRPPLAPPSAVRTPLLLPSSTAHKRDARSAQQRCVPQVVTFSSSALCSHLLRISLWWASLLHNRYAGNLLVHLLQRA